MKKLFLLAGVLLLALVLLFDVEVDPQFAMPREVELPDPEQEARYRACVDEQDARIHAETFAAIDNPDVQREVLSTRKAQAARACRQTYPERRVAVEEPFRFNLIDLTFRY